MLFFLGLFVLLYSFLNGARCFFDDRFGRRRFDHFSNNRSSSGSLFGFFLQTLFFTLATTHFTWIVRRAAARRQGADRGSFNGQLRSRFQ